LIKVRDSAEARLSRAIRPRGDYIAGTMRLRICRGRVPSRQSMRKCETGRSTLSSSEISRRNRELDASINASPADFYPPRRSGIGLLRAGDAELSLGDAEQAGKLAIWAVRPKLLQAIALVELNRSGECADLLVRDSIRLEPLSAENLEAFRRLDGQIAVERTNPICLSHARGS